jgi:hypothetical protein
MGATLIDSLVVKLGLTGGSAFKSDAKGATKAMSEAEKSASGLEVAQTKVKKTNKETSKSFEDVSAGAAKFLAIIGGVAAIRAFILDVVDMNAELGRFARNQEMSVELTSAWEQAAQQIGGSAQGVLGTIGMLSRAQTDLRIKGESGLVPYFNMLGVSMMEAGGRMRPVNDMLLDLSGKLSKMDRTQAFNIAQMMGIDPGTTNLLLQGRVALQAQLDILQKTTATTKAQTDEAERLQKSIAHLKQQFMQLGMRLLQIVEPVLEKVFRIVEKITNWMLEHQEFVKSFFVAFATGLALIALATSPLTLTIVTLLALSTAIAALYQDYEKWKNGQDSFIDWSKWEPGIELAIDGIKELITVMQTALALLPLIQAHGIQGARKAFIQKTTAGTSTGDLQKMMQADPGNVAIQQEITRRKNQPAIIDAARAQAERVSKDTGIPAGLIFGAWAQETNDFKKIARPNNLAGINNPGSTTGTDYRTFGSLDEFGNTYASILKRNFPDTLKATTPEEFAAALKNGRGGRQYFTGDESSYAKRIGQFMGDVGLGGSASPSSVGDTTTDNSKKVHVGEIKIYTAATDAPGITRDMGNALDLLTVSQANSGITH